METMDKYFSIGSYNDLLKKIEETDEQPVLELANRAIKMVTRYALGLELQDIGLWEYDSVITQVRILCDICLRYNISRMFTGDLKNRRHVDKFCREVGTELFPQLFAKPACKSRKDYSKAAALSKAAYNKANLLRRYFPMENQKNKIRVQTELGMIVAYPADPPFPGIVVDLELPDGDLIPLALVERDADNDSKLTVRVYGDCLSEDPTADIVIKNQPKAPAEGETT